MPTYSRAVLTSAVVFALAMGALESGGWWWAWLAATVVVACKAYRPLWIGWVKLTRAACYIVRETHKTRRYNRELARHHPRIQRPQHRTRRRQTR
jgi:hypothetical protein